MEKSVIREKPKSEKKTKAKDKVSLSTQRSSIQKRRLTDKLSEKSETGSDSSERGQLEEGIGEKTGKKKKSRDRHAPTP